MSTSSPPPVPFVDIVVPAYNEAKVLEVNITRLHRHLSTHLPWTWRITIAENASTDDTLRIARSLADEFSDIRVLHLTEPGRGRALRAAWSSSDAEAVAYLDADLSTDLSYVEGLIAPIAAGTADVAIGSRLVSGATVQRSATREAISRAYNTLVRIVLRARFRDAQCGFKALRREHALALLPQVVDEGWFFDTELLLVAQRAGLRIAEVPVRWTEDTDSSVRILSTAIADLRGVSRMTWTRAPR